MRILLAGSSGFLGGALADRLTTRGHEVVRLVRRAPGSAHEVRWNPAGGALDPALVSTVDVAVNLAGAGVADHRWTESYKKTIRDSRVDTTTTLARSIAAAAAAGTAPRALLNASAIGFYGDTGDRVVDEQSPAGDGFLAEVCRVWEAATGPAEDAGVRVVHLRTGIPLSRQGGMLKPLVLPFRLGLGTRLGSGRQYLPWISLADWLGAVAFLMGRDDVAGPVNVVGPAPVTNARFTRALARAVGRPAFLTVPTPALRLALGGFGGEATASQRVMPGVLTAAGYRFEHADVDAALRAALADPALTTAE